MAFLVLSQSCDLAQRDGEPCKAEYVNLCVIRELAHLLPRILEPCCGAGVPGVFTTENRWNAEQLLRRVINQNEQARGLFYLHRHNNVGITAPSVALLRVSIALRREHYGLLQESRCGRLGPEYSAKLGWLAGNLYSRIATPDWEDQEKDKAASRKQAQSLLRLVSEPNDENWVPAKWVRAAQEKHLNLTEIPIDRFRSVLAEHAPPERVDVVLDSVVRVGRRVFAEKVYDAVRRILADQEQFAREVARRVGEVAGGLLAADEHAELEESLSSDLSFRVALGNHVANVLRANAVDVGLDAVAGLAGALAGTTGMIAPAGKRFQSVLSAVLGVERASEAYNIATLVADSCIFTKAATDSATEVAQAVFGQVDLGMLDKLVSRLRNDQKLRSACREQSSDRGGASVVSDWE